MTMLSFWSIASRSRCLEQPIDEERQQQHLHEQERNVADEESPHLVMERGSWEYQIANGVHGQGGDEHRRGEVKLPAFVLSHRSTFRWSALHRDG